MAKLIHIVNSYHISSYCVHGTERKYFFYGLEICNHICAQHFMREKGVLQECQIWLCPLW